MDDPNAAGAERRLPGSDRRVSDRRAAAPEPRPEPAPEYVGVDPLRELIDGEDGSRPGYRLVEAAAHCRDCGRSMIVGAGDYLRCASLEFYEDTAKAPRGATPTATVIYCGGWAVR